MGDVGEEVGRFEAALDATPGAWKSLDVRTVAVRLREEWHNVLTLVRLDPREVDQLPADEVLAETSSVLALRMRLPAAAREQLSSDVRAGRCELHGRTICFQREVRGTRAPYNYAYSSLAAALQDVLPDPHGGVGHQLGISGDAASTILDTNYGGLYALDDELRAAAEPWDGFLALLEHGLGWKRRPDSFTAQLLVCAPLPVRLRHSTGRLADGHLSVVTEADNHGLAPWCSLGFVARRDGRMRTRGSWQAPDGGDWIEQHDLKLWVIERELDLADGPPHDVLLFLRVGPFVVDRLAVVDERRRMRHVLRSAYLTLDEEMRSLEMALLQPRRSDQVEFERAVARALLFAGFAVDSYAGDSRRSDAVDVLAHAPEHRLLLVVECTTGPLQSRDGKLSRLAMRARAVSAALRTPGGDESETRIVAVMATSLARSELGQWDQRGAQADDIVVLDNGALAELLAVARGGQGPAAVLAMLQQHASGRERAAGLLARTWLR